MQLGTRWSFGEQPPAKIPPAMLQSIRAVEADRATQPVGDVTQWRWTLTWLEGRPIAELEDGTIVRFGAQQLDDDESEIS
jgi:hypothetical protein